MVLLVTPIGSSGYLIDSSGYPIGSSGYPIGSFGYPIGSSGYLIGSSGYLIGSSGYLIDSSGYPIGSSGYPIVFGFQIHVHTYPRASVSPFIVHLDHYICPRCSLCINLVDMITLENC